jgi:hypothetical protein
MAEGEGFEPPVALTPLRFSRPLRSTAPASLREDDPRITSPTWAGQIDVWSRSAERLPEFRGMPQRVGRKAFLSLHAFRSAARDGGSGTTETVAQPPHGHSLAMPPNWRNIQTQWARTLLARPPLVDWPWLALALPTQNWLVGTNQSVDFLGERQLSGSEGRTESRRTRFGSTRGGI